MNRKITLKKISAIMLVLTTVFSFTIPVFAEAAPLVKIVKTIPQVIEKKETPIPVLMYHHFIKSGPVNDMIVTEAVFDMQMKSLKENGYTAITPDELIAYANDKSPLPDKPILITMDDGYTSNLDIAAPIMEKYGMKATIFVIGLNEGQKFYPHSGEILSPPRFAYEDAVPWIEKGVITIQSHTFDMHQRESYGFSGRDGVLMLKNEPELKYRAELQKDLEASRQSLLDGLGVEMKAIAFPFGLTNSIANGEVKKAGVKLTFVTEHGISTAVAGNPNSIYCMKRITVTDAFTGEDLIGMF